jgi:ribosomal protein L27
MHQVKSNDQMSSLKSIPHYSDDESFFQVGDLVVLSRGRSYHTGDDIHTGRLHRIYANTLCTVIKSDDLAKDEHPVAHVVLLMTPEKAVVQCLSSAFVLAK